MKPVMKPARRRDHGYTLIELMVAAFIGLTVTGAVLAVYAESRRTLRVQAMQAELEENAALALTLLSRELQLAGYAQPVGVTQQGDSPRFVRSQVDRPVFGCERGLNGTAQRSQAAPWEASVCRAGGDEDHVIEIVYEADAISTLPASSTAGDAPTNCLGAALSKDGQGHAITRNRYYVAPSSAGRSELHCAGAQGAPGQPLADHVERMKLWYGVADADDPDRIVRYVTASAVTNWQRVLGVRACLLMRSSEPVSGEDLSGYLDCDGQAQTAGDRHLRRAHTMTVALRNKVAQ